MTRDSKGRFTKMKTTMAQGFKGFNKDMTCRGYRFEEGGAYKHKGIAKACESGFHFCENPLDVLRYYPPATSRFAEVEGGGQVDRHNDDSKVACTELKVKTEIGLKGLIDAGIKFTFNRVAWGGEDTPQTHGNYSAAQTHGYYSAASVFGEESVAVSTGIRGRAQGIKDSWLVLAEWEETKNGWHIKAVKTAMVDGVVIKEKVFYQLVDGEFMEAA